MNAIVLGSTSYLGKNIINFYNKNGQKCIGVSRSKPSGITYNHSIYNEDFDINEAITQNNIEVVFYCFNSYYKNPSKVQIDEMIKVNFEKPKELIEKILSSNQKTKFINFSSYFNFFDTPDESYDYQMTKLEFSNWFKINSFPKNIKELIISDVFGAWDNRSKIFNIILKNIVLNKEIKLTNPDNLVNLIHIDKLIEYIDRFVNSSKNSATYTSKYSISVGNLKKLLKKLIEDEMCKLGDFFSYENRFQTLDNFYGESTISDIVKVTNNNKYKTYLINNG